MSSQHGLSVLCCVAAVTNLTVGHLGRSKAVELQEQPEVPVQGKHLFTVAFLKAGGYCDPPIQVASTHMDVGAMTLKRVCRAKNINRWPFVKRKSLGIPVERTKQALYDGTGKDNMQKLAVVKVLEKQRQVMQSFQGKHMSDRIKCYRQAVSKLNHIKRQKRKIFACVFDGKLSCLQQACIFPSQVRQSTG